MARQQERCFLCGKVKLKVNQLVKDRFGYVCDECVNEAYEVLNQEDEEEISFNMQLAMPTIPIVVEMPVTSNPSRVSVSVTKTRFNIWMSRSDGCAGTLRVNWIAMC